MYAYIILPYQKSKPKVVDQSIKKQVKGVLKSCCKYMGLSLDDKTIDSVSEVIAQANALNSKYSITAFAQMLMTGKVGLDEVLDYMFTCLSRYFDNAIARGLLAGYQSVDSLRYAIKNGNINAVQVFQAIGAVFKAMQEDGVSAENTIIIDCVSSETSSFNVEVAKRRVENGQEYTEFLSNQPVEYTLECAFYATENYDDWLEFKTYIKTLIAKKTVVKLQLGKEQIKNVALTNFNPKRDGATPVRQYSISFKEIKVGSSDTNYVPDEYLEKNKTQETPDTVENPNSSSASEKQQKEGFITSIYKTGLKHGQAVQSAIVG